MVLKMLHAKMLGGFLSRDVVPRTNWSETGCDPDLGSLPTGIISSHNYWKSKGNDLIQTQGARGCRAAHGWGGQENIFD